MLSFTRTCNGEGRPPRLAHAGARLGQAAGAAVRRWPAHQHRGHRQAYVLLFGAFGAARDDAMVARWSANPLGMLWPEMDVEFVTSGGGDGPAVLRRRVIVIAAD